MTTGVPTHNLPARSHKTPEQRSGDTALGTTQCFSVIMLVTVVVSSGADNARVSPHQPPPARWRPGRTAAARSLTVTGGGKIKWIHSMEPLGPINPKSSI